MSDRRIIKQAADQVGQEIGRLQGRLFVVESEAASIRTQIQRLDQVYQNLLKRRSGETVETPTTISPQEAIDILRDRLPLADPASQETCLDTLRILLEENLPLSERNKVAITRLEKHAWKQGEAIALVQQVVRCLRSV